MTDIREEKIKLWLEHPPKMKFPKPLNLPPFSKKSFRSYEEMNAWKREYLQEIARNGGIPWDFGESPRNEYDFSEGEKNPYLPPQHEAPDQKR